MEVSKELRADLIKRMDESKSWQWSEGVVNGSEIRGLINDLEEYEAGSKFGQWQKISTAPSDGRRIFLAGRVKDYAWVSIGSWYYAYKMWGDDHITKHPPTQLRGPMYWQPIPKPPDDCGKWMIPAPPGDET